LSTDKDLDKFANDKNFKKNMANFFGVENEFPRPNYDKIGPAKHEDDLTSGRLFILF